MDAEGREQSDADLLARYRRGEVEAMEVLVARYRGALFAFILNMTGDPQDANDIFQEVWFRAIRTMGRYREQSLLAWLTRIARNLVIDRWRRRKPTVSLNEEPEDGVALIEKVADPGHNPAEAAAAAEMRRRLASAIDELPPEQREVVWMRAKQELPFREIARMQGTSINTALARMHYAMGKLRKTMGAGIGSEEGAAT